MKKYLLKLVKNYNPLDNSYPESPKLWAKIIKISQRILRINKCKLYVFQLNTEIIDQHFNNITIEKEQDEYNNFWYTLSVDDYLQYNKTHNNGYLYGKNEYEDPEFYSDDKKIIDTISHERYVYFFINQEEKKLLERELLSTSNDLVLEETK